MAVSGGDGTEGREAPDAAGGDPAGEVARLKRELNAVDTERIRLRSELEQIRRSPVGRLIDQARTMRTILDRHLWRLRTRLPRLTRGGADRPRRLPPRLSGSELAWLARRRLSPRRAGQPPAPVAAPAGGAWLTPILVDYFGRDGSTAIMALLATSTAVVVDEKYPYERRYFTYLWRWSRLLSRTDWPGALWAKDDVVSISQEQDQALLGPPPWLPRELLEGGRDGAPISRRCFELAWGELSARAIARAGEGAAPRYYAEKHCNTWHVDSRELPPLKLIVLLRDPRDTQASIRAFEDKEPATSFAIQDAWAGTDRLDGILDRHRQRLRWIAGLLEDESVPVIRYEELDEDLGGVARRLGERLEIELDPTALDGGELTARHGSSRGNGRTRWERDLDPRIAERFTRELRPELRAVGLSS
ncbi:MAG: sulfotransferase domain-containing protein [Solirubrobacterales bacterium]